MCNAHSTSVKKRFIWFLNTNAFIEFRSHYEKNKSYWFCLEHIDLELLCARPPSQRKSVYFASFLFIPYVHPYPHFPLILLKQKNSSEKFSFGNIFYLHIYKFIRTYVFSFVFSTDVVVIVYYFRSNSSSMWSLWQKVYT